MHFQLSFEMIFLYFLRAVNTFPCQPANLRNKFLEENLQYYKYRECVVI